jgi:acyl carrier protein
MTELHRPRDAATVRTWLVGYITSVLDVPTDPFPAAEPFNSYGFDSTEVVIMAGVMEEEFGVELEPAILFENPSVDGFVDALVAAEIING